MRPIWKGHISFGLVSVPVTLFPAEQRTEVQFHLIDSRDHARVRYERVNAETGEEVPWDQVVKGYEYNDGNYVLIGDEDFKRAAPEASKAVEIQGFVDGADIDPMYFDKPYFLEPGKGGEKGYALLREVLRETGKMGIARVVIRTRQYLAAMAPRGDVLVLTLLRYRHELRSPKDLTVPGDLEKVGVSKAEVKMARTLVESMARPWDPSEYQDEYRDALMQWIQKKIDSGQTERVAERAADDDAPAPINLMEALKRSLQSQGGSAPDAAETKPKRERAARSRSPSSKDRQEPQPARKPSRRKTG
ncbi:MAG: Ku protein [Planctomycetota bacterium]|nr:Ku protein [Planctomycetota bacterium]